jgi:hypothetical protein
MQIARSIAEGPNQTNARRQTASSASSASSRSNNRCSCCLPSGLSGGEENDQRAQHFSRYATSASIFRNSITANEVTTCVSMLTSASQSLNGSALSDEICLFRSCRLRRGRRHRSSWVLNLQLDVIGSASVVHCERIGWPEAAYGAPVPKTTDKFLVTVGYGIP